MPGEDQQQNPPHGPPQEEAPVTELDVLYKTISDVEDTLLKDASEQEGLLTERARLVDKEGKPADQQRDALLDAQLKVIEERMKRKDKRLEQLRQRANMVWNTQKTAALSLDLTTYVEGRKLNYDTFKQITTLGTGSIVILSGLASNVLNASEWRLFLVLAIGSLFVSVCSAVYAMRLTHILLSASRIPEGELKDVLPSAGLERLYKYTLRSAHYSFLLGIAALLVFFIKNVFCATSP